MTRTTTTEEIAPGTSGAIIEAVYEAAFDATRWPQALAQLGRVVDADSAFFFSTHSDVDPDAVLHVHNQPGEMLTEFTRHWYTEDPWAHGARQTGRMRRGTLVVGAELIEAPALRRTAFYNEFSRQYGIEALVGSVLFDGTEAEPMPFTNISWYRRGGREFDFAERDRLRPFLPHVQHSMRIQRRIGWLGDRRAQDAFSTMRVASILLDRAGAVRHYNDAGGELLAALPAGCMRFGRLRALGERASMSVAEALALAAHGQPARVTAVLEGPRPVVFAATVMRLGATGAEAIGVASTEGSPTYLLLAELPRTGGRETAQAVASLFHLTPAEVRVLAGLLDGLSPAQIAAAGGASLSTVRTQISSLLAKTQTASQTELLVLLRGLRV